MTNPSANQLTSLACPVWYVCHVVMLHNTLWQGTSQNDDAAQMHGIVRFSLLSDVYAAHAVLEQSVVDRDSCSEQCVRPS